MDSPICLLRRLMPQLGYVSRRAGGARKAGETLRVGLLSSFLRYMYMCIYIYIYIQFINRI